MPDNELVRLLSPLPPQHHRKILRDGANQTDPPIVLSCYHPANDTTWKFEHDYNSWSMFDGPATPIWEYKQIFCDEDEQETNHTARVTL